MPEHPFLQIADKPPTNLHQVKDRLYAVCQGCSMTPTLREGDLMEILPYGQRPIRIGDVILFKSPIDGALVVHRVVGATAEGLRTQGDHNSLEDDFHVTPDAIIGQVIALWRGQRRRKLAGGTMGKLVAGWMPWRRRLGRLTHNPVGRRVRQWLAEPLAAGRTRKVVFHVKGQPQVWVVDEKGKRRKEKG